MVTNYDTKESVVKTTFYRPWKAERSNQILESMAFWLAEESGPWANELKKLIASWDVYSLCRYSINYDEPNVSIRNIVCARQCVALFSKNASLSIHGISPDAEGFKKFMLSEQDCRLTNKRFRNYATEKLSSGFGFRILHIREKLAQILGPCPSLSDLDLEFGPGSNTTVMIRTSARYKLQAHPVCSKDSLEAVKQLWDTVPTYAFAHKGRCRVGMGHLSFVPKKATESRPTITEPLLNTFVQKGIGSWIKRRLMANGINLLDQSINRNRAKQGSLDGTYCTIDLSSASDTIAYWVVMTLLPRDWFELLATWRTSTVTSQEFGLKSLELEKFSSMGNGFTFELESLLFYAISSSAIEISGGSPDVSVYGDDIIVPNKHFSHVSNWLNFFGFTVNNGKSFNSGPFRESCGGDYYRGINVRPYYFKRLLDSASLIGFLNHHKRNTDCLPEDMYHFCLGHVPESDCFFGPDGLGDGHVISDEYPVVVDNKRVKLGWECTTKFTTIQKEPVIEKLFNLPIGDSLLPYYNSSSKLSADFPEYVFTTSRRSPRIRTFASAMDDLRFRKIPFNFHIKANVRFDQDPPVGDDDTPYVIRSEDGRVKPKKIFTHS